MDVLENFNINLDFGFNSQDTYIPDISHH